MPVMLAVMEIPGCLVGLALISHMRRTGMDRWGNMPGEPGYLHKPGPEVLGGVRDGDSENGDEPHGHGGRVVTAVVKRAHGGTATATAVAVEEMEEEPVSEAAFAPAKKPEGLFSPKVLHEVFLNPGLYLLFGGIVVG